jgi:hypothetical protein
VFAEGRDTWAIEVFVRNLLAYNGSIKAFLNSVPGGVVIGGDVEGVVSGFVQQRWATFADVRSRPEGSVDRDGISIRQSYDGLGTADLLLNLSTGNYADRRTYQFVRDCFSGLFQGWTVVPVRRDQGRAELVFNRGAHEFDVPQGQVGTGVLEILTIITNLLGYRDTVFVIEEPELHLHPQAQRALQTLILEASSRNQVFVITHSPIFVDAQRLEGLTRVHIHEDTSRLHAIPKDFPSRDRDRLKSSLGNPERRELLFARAVGLVEGDSEIAFLAALVARRALPLHALGISLVSVEGEDDFKSHLRYLDALCIPAHCLRDKPLASSNEQVRRRFTIVGHEFEDAIRGAGQGDLLEKATKEVGQGKARVARHVGDVIDLEKVPPVYGAFLKRLEGLATGDAG